MSYKYLVNIDSNDELKESDILKFLTTPEHLNIPMNMVNVQQYNNTNIKISNNTFLVESDLLFRTTFILNCLVSINHSISTKFIVTKL